MTFYDAIFAQKSVRLTTRAVYIANVMDSILKEDSLRDAVNRAAGKLKVLQKCPGAIYFFLTIIKLKQKTFPPFENLLDFAEVKSPPLSSALQQNHSQSSSSTPFC